MDFLQREEKVIAAIYIKQGSLAAMPAQKMFAVVEYYWNPCKSNADHESNYTHEIYLLFIFSLWIFYFLNSDKLLIFCSLKMKKKKKTQKHYVHVMPFSVSVF